MVSTKNKCFFFRLLPSPHSHIFMGMDATGRQKWDRNMDSEVESEMKREIWKEWEKWRLGKNEREKHHSVWYNTHIEQMGHFKNIATPQKSDTREKAAHSHTGVQCFGRKKQKWKLTKWIEKKRTTQWQDPTNTYRKYAHGINKSPACWNSKQDDTHKNVCVWETEGERVNKRSDRIKPNQTIRNRWYDDNNSNPIQYAGRGIFGSKLLFVAISSIKQSHNITHTNIHPQAYEHMIFCLAPSVIIGSKTIPAFSLLFLSRHTK